MARIDTHVVRRLSEPVIEFPSAEDWSQLLKWVITVL
jgi:hypothetical protein